MLINNIKKTIIIIIIVVLMIYDLLYLFLECCISFFSFVKIFLKDLLLWYDNNPVTIIIYIDFFVKKNYNKLIEYHLLDGTIFIAIQNPLTLRGTVNCMLQQLLLMILINV